VRFWRKKKLNIKNLSWSINIPIYEDVLHHDSKVTTLNLTTLGNNYVLET